MPQSRLLATVLTALATGCVHAAPASAAQPGPGPTVELTVDATDAPRHMTRAHLVIPVHAGPLTLAYPKWIPGEHGPTGPLVDLAGLVIKAGDKTIPWRRDSERIFEFHVDVPEGASKLDVDLVFLEPLEAHGFSAGASATAQLFELAWNHLLVYPSAWAPEQLTYVAKLKLPAGWKYGTALPVAREDGGTIQFAPAPLTTLIDSPVIAGAHERVIVLGPETGPKHEIDLVADSEEALAMTDQQIAAYKQLVLEAGALFGARHYRDYHFLYSLSDHVASFGLEHHESSDDRVGERTLIDEDRRRGSVGLLPHEFVHSWNGKFRRPRGLATRNYQEPMRGDLLWIYEGLTQYLGWVLTARSGLFSDMEAHEYLAQVAAHMDAQVGRQWRPLGDTAVAAQILYEAPEAWSSMRRGVDYYPEGLLVWLDADVVIRQKTGGKASLDDFCQKFHGGKDGPPEVRAYDLDEVVRTLDTIAPNDWRAFFDARIQKAAPRAPLDGITGGGYKLSFDEKANVETGYSEKIWKYHEAWYSLGIVVGEHEEVLDVAPGKPAAVAGLAPGMHLVAVDGRRYNDDVLHDALVRASKSQGPMELLVESGDFFKTLEVTWHGGELHPHLERDASKPDVLSQILSPRTPRPVEAVATPPKPTP